MFHAVHAARSAMHMSLPPLSFLKQDQDINQRPKNWLVHDDRLQGRAPRAPRQTESDELRLSALVGAVDLSEKIDFIAAAEDMKQLFMLPYTEKDVSLAIHNVGGRLLINSSASLGSQAAMLSTDGGSVSSPLKKKKCDKNTKSKRLYSKFLYHSVTDEPCSSSSSTPSSSPSPSLPLDSPPGRLDEAAGVPDVPGVWIHNAVTGEIMFKAKAPSSPPPPATKKLLESGRTPIHRRIQDAPRPFLDAGCDGASDVRPPLATPAVHEVGTRMVYVYNPETKETSLAPLRPTSDPNLSSVHAYDAPRSAQTSTPTDTVPPDEKSSQANQPAYANALMPRSSSAAGASSHSQQQQSIQTRLKYPPSDHHANSFMPGNSAKGQFRTVHRWNFGNQSMLLGSNLILFQRQPLKSSDVIALALHDVDDAFSQQVVLGHWLDCTFANCPALALCFHRNGRVLGYHLVRTSDIPRLRLRDLPMNVGEKLEATAIALAEANEDASGESRRGATRNNEVLRTEDGVQASTATSAVIQTNRVDRRTAVSRQKETNQQVSEPCFDPDEVCARAAELLRTLQRQCSRDSGTYCLFRKSRKARGGRQSRGLSSSSGKHHHSPVDSNTGVGSHAGENKAPEDSPSEFMQLFDLSSRMVDPAQQRKWKYLLAMVCFRFAARSARLDGSSMDRPEIHRQRELLTQCLKLLKEVYELGGSKHASILAAVRVQLSETYVREQALYGAGDFDTELNQRTVDETHSGFHPNEFRDDISDVRARAPCGSSKTHKAPMSKSMRRRIRRNKAKQQRKKQALGSLASTSCSVLSMSKCVSFAVRQWIEACNHLSKGMRELQSLWKGGASSNEEDGNEFIFEQVQDLAQRLVQCTSGLTQSIRGMQANAQQKDCQCGSDACFAPLLLNMLETTVIQCQGVLKLRRKLPSGSRLNFQRGSREKSDADASLTMLATIGDAALSIWHVAGANEIKAPASIEAILSSFAPAQAMPQFGGDCRSELDVPCHDAEFYWLRVGIFAFSVGVAAGGATSLPLVRKLAAAKNTLGQMCLAQLDYDQALDVFSAALNMFTACNDAVNIALVSLNIVATFRRMASGRDIHTLTTSSATNPELLEPHQASLYENALSLCAQTLADLEEKTSHSDDPKHQHKLKAVKRNIMLLHAQVCLDFGERLGSTLDASLHINASYSLERHLEAANKVLGLFRNATRLSDAALSLVLSDSSVEEGQRIKGMALCLSGRFYGKLATFFGKPVKPAHLMVASKSDWKKRARLNLELAKRSFERAMKAGGGAGDRARVELDELLARWKRNVKSK